MDNVADIFPLTPAQAGILYDGLRNPDPELYFEQVRADVWSTDPSVLLDGKAWATAWNVVVDRHMALRTAIVWEGLEEPVQVVRTKARVAVEIIGADQALGAAEALELLDQRAADHKRAGFDLRRAPLSRVAVAEIEPGRWHMVWSFHHIVLDGWSVGIVLDDLADALGGTLDQQPAPQFRRHMEWLASADRSSDRSFWEARVGDVTATTRPDLPPPTESVEPGTIGRLRRSLDDGLSDRLVTAAATARVTPSTFVQAAWAVTLGAYCDNDDVVFGVTMAGRSVEIHDVGEIAGMFLSTLPMRVDVSASDGPRWLKGLQAAQLDLLARQHCSLADVTRWSGVGAGGELFDTVLVFENFPERSGTASIEIETTDVFEQADFGLTMLIRSADTVDLMLMFDQARYGAEAVERMVDHFLGVLAGFADDPEAAPRDRSVLTLADRHRLLVDLNDTDAEPDDATVPALWRRRVDEAPDATAIIDGGRVVQRRVLDEMAVAAASALSELGVGPGDRVGIHAFRSVDTLAAMLGTVMLGAIYLPLDPTYPSARLQLIVDDAKPAITVVDQRTSSDWVGRSVMVSELVAAESTSLGDVDVDCRDAFVMTYTSGSTGVPKGVPLHHRGLVERCRWQWSRYPLDDGEVMVAKTSLNFVDHLWELWGGLLGGATVAVVDEGTARDPRTLVDVVELHAARRLVMTPSSLSAVLDAVPDAGRRLASLQWLTVSGEPAGPALVSEVAQRLPDATLLNLFGMSEATADSTWYDTSWLGVTDRDGLSSVPIGRPIRNTRAFVLDRSGDLAPEGVTGRLHLSGAGLTHGYWERPDLTAERFAANHLEFDDPHGLHDRLYDTGDLARWVDGDVLEHRGRSDEQVKIRGTRVELGDVEAALSSCEGVERAVAATVVDDSTQRLIAAVTLSSSVDADVAASSIRRDLAAVLPDAFVPTTIHVLDALPTTPNGKLDRRAVGAWHATMAATSAIGAADAGGIADETVSKMCAIFSDVVGASFGPDDDFFDLGGHSLDAIRLLSRVGSTFDVRVTLPELLDNTTPRQLALRVGSTSPHTDEAGRRHLVPLGGTELSPEGSDRPSGVVAPPFIVVHGAGGHVLALRDLADAVAEHRPVIGVQARGVDGVSEPHESIAEMADAYVSELIETGIGGPVVLGGYSAGGAIAIEMAGRLTAMGVEVTGVVLLDTYHPATRLAERPSLAAMLRIARLGPGEIRRRLIERLDRNRRHEAFEALLDEGVVDGEVIPEELRFERLNRQIAAAYWSWRPGEVSVPVALLATAEINWTLESAGELRGWEQSLQTLRRFEVPGDHHQFLVGDGARKTAQSLEAAVEWFGQA